MSAVTRTATIANGASLSGAVEISESMIIGLNLPAAWTTADLTLQASSDNAPTTFNNVYDKDGTEVTIKAGASRYVTLKPVDFMGMHSIKLRSGTSGTPVNQGAARSIAIVLYAE